jgi:sugar diacid utilization regulator
LIYRLDKTKKLIGLDPRHFDDALQIKLGLMFYQQS